MRQAAAPVVARVELSPGTFLLTLEAPWLAGARPGQFVHLRCGDSYDPLLRRPLSICRVGSLALTPSLSQRERGREGEFSPPLPAGERVGVRGGISAHRSWPTTSTDPHPNPLPERERGQVSLLFRAVGKGTAWLAAREPGDTLDVLGPLGRPFTIAPASRHLLLVGGGVGVAPLVMLADEAVSRGLTVTLAMGAKSGDEIYPGRLLPPEVEYIVATEDGSLGHKGFVTEALNDLYDHADQVFACGPLGMLAAVKRLSRRRPATPVQVSLEEHMGCAVGVCYGCAIPTTRGPQRVCADGPVFDLDEVILE